MRACHDNHPGQSRGRSVLRMLVGWFRLTLSIPVWLYQRVVSPVLPGSCIYTPTCSEYSRQAILRFGLRGVALAILRIGRCAGALYVGGDDPIPDRITAAYLFGSYRTRWRRGNRE